MMADDSKPRHFAHIGPGGACGGLVEYSDAPTEAPAGAVALTAEQFQRWREGMATHRWDAARGDIVSCAPTATAQPVPKTVIVERLIAAGSLRALRRELRFGVPDTALTDDELAVRERWEVAVQFMTNDSGLRGALHRAEADADSILAPP